MAKKGKFIDGISSRPNPQKRQVGLDADFSHKDTTKTHKSRKVKVSTPKQKQPTPVPVAPQRQLTEEEVAAAFIGPDDEITDLISDAPEDTPQKTKPKKPKKKWSKTRKFFTVFALLLIVAGVVFYIWGDAIIAKLTGGNSNLFDVITAVVTNKDTPLKTDKNGRTNILVMGTSGYDMGGSDHDGAQLTDSIMVISLDQEKKDAALISLPRDLKVGYTCTATGKINEVYWCANMDDTDEEGGARALMNEVKDILGIDIQYYAHLDWGALIDVVNSIGGITVTLDEDIADYWTNTFITAGVPTTLDGEAALGLARARHGTENGDFSRGASQQKIMFAIKDKIIEKGLGVTETINLLNALGDNLRMNFSIDELKTAAKLLQDFPAENIRQLSLVDTPDGSLVTTATIGGISYVVPSAGVGVYSYIQNYIKTSLSTDPVVREGAKILVLNGTDTAGVAGAEQKTLDSAGYIVGAIGDAPAGDYPNAYYLYDISGKKPSTKKSLEERYQTTSLDAKALPAGIYADSYDFVLILGDQSQQSQQAQ